MGPGGFGGACACGKSGSGLEERVYYLTDANMNVTAILDGTPGSQTLGEAVERYHYDPYGKVTFLEGSTGGQTEWNVRASQSSTVGNEVLFAGYRRDNETGLYHVRNRPYHPLLGRWLTRDRLGYVDGMSLYEYCRSGVTVWLDPLGNLVIYAAGAAEDLAVGVLKPDLARLSGEAQTKLQDYAYKRGPYADRPGNEQRFVPITHERTDLYSGAWNEATQIRANANRILAEILKAGPDEPIYIFAHSTGAAAVVLALEDLRKHNAEVAAQKRRYVDVLVIYAGSVSRCREGLRETLAETTFFTFLLRGQDDPVAWLGAAGGNAIPPEGPSIGLPPFPFPPLPSMELVFPITLYPTYLPPPVFNLQGEAGGHKYVIREYDLPGGHVDIFREWHGHPGKTGIDFVIEYFQEIKTR